MTDPKQEEEKYKKNKKMNTKEKQRHPRSSSPKKPCSLSTETVLLF